MGPISASHDIGWFLMTESNLKLPTITEFDRKWQILTYLGCHRNQKGIVFLRIHLHFLTRAPCKKVDKIDFLEIPNYNQSQRMQVFQCLKL